MKRILPLFLAILLAGSLTACVSLAPTPYSDMQNGYAFEIATQYDTYAPDAEVIHAVLYNGSDESLHFGADWSMEVLRDGSWYRLPFVENACWISIAYELMPGGSFPFEVHTSMLAQSLKAGTYRIIKEISGVPCAAEFTVAKDGVGKENPHGYVPLEKLPAKYDDAYDDGVIFVNSLGEHASAAIEAFFTHYEIGMSTQLRLGIYNDQHQLILEDLLVEKKLGTRQIRYRRDETRAGGTITETFYSYFVTDGGEIYLSNTPVFDNNAVLIPLLENFDWFGHSERKERLKNTTGMYPAFWSPDGMKLVKLHGAKLEFSLSYLYEDGGQSGSVESIASVPGMKKITGAVWNGDSESVILICETERAGMTGYVTYSVTENKVVSYTSTFSIYGYHRDENGNILIPE